MSYDGDDTQLWDQFKASRWFTRGWTLQELIAPSNVLFFTQNWGKIAAKTKISHIISEITLIDPTVLDEGNIEICTVAEKMSWAAKRKTTRVEDMAYCLLGLFDVNIPLLYGEGTKAFFRLQEEIMKSTEDQSLFAWGLDPVVYPLSPRAKPIDERNSASESDGVLLKGLMAESPEYFWHSGCVKWTALHWPGYSESQAIIRRHNIRIKLPIISQGDISYAILACGTQQDHSSWLAIPLKKWNERYYGRTEHLISVRMYRDSKLGDVDVEKSLTFVDIAPQTLTRRLGTYEHRDILLFYSDSEKRVGSMPMWSLDYITYVKPTVYDSRLFVLKPGKRVDGNFAILTFENERTDRFSILLARTTVHNERDDKTWVRILSNEEMATLIKLHGPKDKHQTTLRQLSIDDFNYRFASFHKSAFQEVYPLGPAKFNLGRNLGRNLERNSIIQISAERHPLQPQKDAFIERIVVNVLS